MTAPESHSPLVWRKSTYSGTTNGSECVELAELPNGTIAVRNSNQPAAGTVHFTRSEMRAWIAGVKNGEFDDLT